MKKNIFLNFIIVLFLLFDISVTYANSNVIYSNANNIFSKNENYDDTFVVKPKEEKVYEFNDVIKPKKNPNTVEKTTIYMPSLYDDTNYISTTSNIKYIRRTSSITTVNDPNWLYDNHKWQLSFSPDDLYSINPEFNFAHSGFYKVNGDIYYFDDSGYMYTGILMDEKDIKYLFDENGKLIYEGK